MVSLLILLICVGVIILSIHERDEIHQMLAFLLGLIALIGAFVLIPLILKIFLGLFFFIVGHKILPSYHSLK